jgi:hypothetical protein
VLLFARRCCFLLFGSGVVIFFLLAYYCWWVGAQKNRISLLINIQFTKNRPIHQTGRYATKYFSKGMKPVTPYLIDGDEILPF